MNASSQLSEPSAIDIQSLLLSPDECAKLNLTEAEQYTEALLAYQRHLDLQEVEAGLAMQWDMMGQKVASLNAGPLLWTTQYTKTEDSHWLAKGTEFKAAFPAKSYLVEMMRLFLSSPTLFVWKSREMMTSWLVSLYIAWMCQWYPVFWVAQTEKEDKVKELIHYAKILHENQPEWMRRRNPLVCDNDTELKWEQGGRFLGVPKGANQIRIHHPYGYFQDESAFLPEAEASFNAVRPVVKQIICVSTDEVGWYHNECKLEA